MPGGIGQLRGQLRLYGPVPGPPGHQGDRPVGLPAGTAAVMLAIALAISGVRTPQWTGQDIAAIVILGIIGTGFAYVLNYQIITSDGATAASTVTCLLPVVAIVLGVLDR